MRIVIYFRMDGVWSYVKKKDGKRQEQTLRGPNEKGNKLHKRKNKGRRAMITTITNSTLSPPSRPHYFRAHEKSSSSGDIQEITTARMDVLHSGMSRVRVFYPLNFSFNLARKPFFLGLPSSSTLEEPATLVRSLWGVPRKKPLDLLVACL